jgi:hypothetical protein
MKDEGVSRQQLASSPFYRYEFGFVHGKGGRFENLSEKPEIRLRD